MMSILELSNLGICFLIDRKKHYSNKNSQNILIFQSNKMKDWTYQMSWHHLGYENSLFKSIPDQQHGNHSVLKLAITGFLKIKWI